MIVAIDFYHARPPLAIDWGFLSAESVDIDFYHAQSTVAIEWTLGGASIGDYCCEDDATQAHLAYIGQPVTIEVPPVLPPYDLHEVTADYFYYGWENVNASWLIRRRLRSDATLTEATIANNASYADLTTAWPQRETLIYTA